MVAAPLTPEELLELCDLAGVAHVLDVGLNPSGWGVVAKLRFSKIVKGGVRTGGWFSPRVALVKVRELSPQPIPGEWSDYYEPGTQVFTHLNWDEQSRLYATTWWNAVNIVP